MLFKVNVVQGLKSGVALVKANIKQDCVAVKLYKNSPVRFDRAAL